MDWRTDHHRIQKQFLNATPPTQDLVLKGGTALMECYGLNRYSEDLDFDARHHRLNTIKHFTSIATTYGYECNIRKNTDLVQRVLIHYGGAKPLKIETSFRRTHIPADELTTHAGILTYTIEQLAVMKANAYMGRDALRDLFDLTYITNTYFDQLSTPTQSIIRYALAQKGIEQFDLLTAEQHDELIDPDALAQNTLLAFDKLDLTTPTPQTRNQLTHIIHTRTQKANQTIPSPS